MLHKRNIPDPSLSAPVKMYERIEIKLILSKEMTQSVQINDCVRQGCPLSLSLSGTLQHIARSKCFQNDTRSIDRGIQITRNRGNKNPSVCRRLGNSRRITDFITKVCTQI